MTLLQQRQRRQLPSSSLSSLVVLFGFLLLTVTLHLPSSLAQAQETETFLSPHDNDSSDNIKNNDLIWNWLQEQQEKQETTAFVSDKIQPSSFSKSNSRLIATTHIPQGDVLLRLDSSLLLTIPKDKQKENSSTACQMAEYLVHEYQTQHQNKQTLTPFVNYLLNPETTPLVLPPQPEPQSTVDHHDQQDATKTTTSTFAKQMQQLVGYELEPQHFVARQKLMNKRHKGAKWYQRDCLLANEPENEEITDKEQQQTQQPQLSNEQLALLERAYAIVLTKAWDQQATIVPLVEQCLVNSLDDYDTVASWTPNVARKHQQDDPNLNNNDNNSNNNDTQDSFVLYALRDIAPGELLIVYQNEGSVFGGVTQTAKQQNKNNNNGDDENSEDDEDEEEQIYIPDLWRILQRYGFFPMAWPRKFAWSHELEALESETKQEYYPMVEEEELYLEFVVEYDERILKHNNNNNKNQSQSTTNVSSTLPLPRQVTWWMEYNGYIVPPLYKQLNWIQAHVRRLKKMMELPEWQQIKMDNTNPTTTSTTETLQRNTLLNYHSALLQSMQAAYWEAMDDYLFWRHGVDVTGRATSAEASTTTETAMEEEQDAAAAEGPAAKYSISETDMASVEGDDSTRMAAATLETDGTTATQTTATVGTAPQQTALFSENPGNSSSLNDATVSSVAYFDELSPDKPDPLEYEMHVAGGLGCEDELEQVHQDEVQSHYQSIRFHHHIVQGIDPTNGSPQTALNTCLWLSDWLQSCTSFRPHYHEWLVHYPAMFLPKVERVLFLGGGDIMIIHEIIKYADQLEFVIGMELDQQVVRQSFRNSAIQPHFDHPKVHWIFGDATKSLLTLPKEYQGTFDLVLVDLQNFVVDTVMVTPTESIMDVAMKMLKPTGILARNEDYITRKNVDFATYTVDLEIRDVPRLCQQSLTMGSNEIDFSSFRQSDLIDHGLEHVYFQFPGGAANGNLERPHFTDQWTDFRKIDMRLTEKARRGNNKDDKSEPVPHHGILTVIEVEDATINLAKLDLIEESVRNALVEHSGLRVDSVFLPDELKPGIEEPDGISMVVVLKEGYVSLSTWPEENYVAFDLFLWTAFDTMTKAISGLVAAVGGGFEKEGANTYFSLVVGGMHGAESTANLKFQSTQDSDEDLTPKTTDSNMGNVVSPVDPQDSVTVIREMANSLLDAVRPPKTVLVLCGHDSSSCNSVDALKSIEKTRLLTIETCPGLGVGGEENHAVMMECFRSTHESIANATSSSQKVRAIVIDQEVSLAMGQILHKTLQSARSRSDYLTDDLLVLVINSGPDQPWRNALLERFRTEMTMFNPVHHANVNFEGYDLQMGIFSAGDTDFYGHLRNGTKAISEKTKLEAFLKESKVGATSYEPDFAPTKYVTSAMYNVTPAAEQWMGQSLLGQQAILQYEIKLPKAPLERGQRILFNDEVHNWYGTWYSGIVLEQTRDGTYIVELDYGETIESERDVLRKFEMAQSPFKFGDRILVKRLVDEDFAWLQGSVTGFVKDGEYKVRIFEDSYGETIASHEDLVHQFESADPTKVSSITTEMLKTLLKDALASFFGEDNFDIFATESVGEGAVIVCFLDDILIVLTWDGRTHLDINVFGFFHQTPLGPFLDKVLTLNMLNRIDHLSLVSKDEQPRGTGRIVNGLEDQSSFWFGELLGYSEESDEYSQ